MWKEQFLHWRENNYMPKAILITKDGTILDGIFPLKPGANLRTGESDLKATFGQLTSLEQDLLNIAAAVFACDLAFKRGERENFTRSIELTIPVVNHALLNSVHDDIVYALYKLSDGTWNIKFINQGGSPESFKEWQQKKDGKILLFSGGIDSFAAAMKLGYLKESVHLISHVTANHIASNAQKVLLHFLDTKFPNQFIRTAVRTGGTNKENKGFSFPTDENREDTQRTRSFLFLTLAAIAARRDGIKDIIMLAENGQLAIHLPLTASRISAFSTHTAHPEFVDCMSTILNSILGYKMRIYNPYLYMTKAEVVASSLTRDLNMIEHTVSCWRSARMIGNSKHCGYCVPCMIRRIANEFNGVKLNEYGRDLFVERIESLGPEDDGRRNFVELAEFIRFFERAGSTAEILIEYPDLINKYIDAPKAIEMYQRFAREARTVLNRYPILSSIMS